MKKVFKLDEVDCALCATKMEDAIKKIPGVIDCSVNFFTQKLTLEADDKEFNEVFSLVVKTCRKIEPDCEIIK